MARAGFLRRPLFSDGALLEVEDLGKELTVECSASVNPVQTLIVGSLRSQLIEGLLVTNV